MSSSAAEGASNGSPPKPSETEGIAAGSDDAHEPSRQDDANAVPASTPKPGILLRLGLDPPTVMMMFK